MKLSYSNKSESINQFLKLMSMTLILEMIYLRKLFLVWVIHQRKFYIKTLLKWMKTDFVRTSAVEKHVINIHLAILLRFSNMRILKFKSQLTIAFFAAVNHLNEPLRKQNFTLTGSKGQGLWLVIGEFRSVLCVSVFQGSLLVIVIMIDGSEKRNCVWRRLLNFRVRMFLKSAVIYHCTCC